MLDWMKKNYLLLILIFVGFIIRFLLVLKYGDFWDDEMFSFLFAQKTWPEGLIYWLWETNPPLHMLILKLWFFIFSANEFWARLPSLILGTLTIPAVYYLAKIIWDKKTALLATLFITLHPYHIFWSATARTYSLLLLLSSLSVYFFYKIFFTATTKNKDRIFLGITNALLLFSHLSATILIFSQLIIILVLNRKKIILWLKINFFPVLLATAWLIPSFLIKYHNHLEKSWLLNLQHNFWSAIGPLINLTGGIRYNGWGLLSASILITLILVIGILHLRKKDIPHLIIFTFLIVPILISILCGVWHIKMLVYTLPFWVIIIAYAINKISPYTIASYFIIISLCLSGLMDLFIYTPFTSWPKVSNYIQTQTVATENQALVYNDFILRTQIDRYLNLSIPNYPFDLAREPNMSWDDLVVKKNYLFLDFSEADLDNWFTKNDLNQYHQIILLQGEYTYMVFLNKTLEKNNYILTTPKTKAPLMGNFYLYTYVKND